MVIDARVLLLNDKRREILREITGHITTINGMYDEMTKTYETMRDLYDELIVNENQMVELERADYKESIARSRLGPTILDIVGTDSVTLDYIIHKVRRDESPPVASAERQLIVEILSELIDRGRVIVVRDMDKFHTTMRYERLN